MSAHITFVQVHTPAQVREILREAASIADDAVDLGVTHQVAFEQACELLAARTILPGQAQPVVFPLSPAGFDR